LAQEHTQSQLLMVVIMTLGKAETKHQYIILEKRNNYGI
jgi:hypothetical protein